MIIREVAKRPFGTVLGVRTTTLDSPLGTVRPIEEWIDEGQYTVPYSWNLAENKSIDPDFYLI